MLDTTKIASDQILSSGSISDLESIDFKIENRQRMLKQIEKIQREIEDSIESLNPQDIEKEDVEILKTWMFEINNWVEGQLDLSNQITSVLEEQKAQVTGEICSVYKNKVAVKGYDLNNLKK